MDETYELALAREGESASALSEDQWLAWEEAFALAPDVAAKKRLVADALDSMTPAFKYYGSLATLLHVQQLLDAATPESDSAAEAVMVAERAALDECQLELMRVHGCERKRRRVDLRRQLLQLEIAKRLDKPRDEIKRQSIAVAETMGMAYHDSAPAIADVIVERELPCVLSDDALSVEARVLGALHQIRNLHHESHVLEIMRPALRDMKVYARELVFAFVAGTKSPPQPHSLSFTTDQRWWILCLFLDECAFDYTYIEGYLEVILEDLAQPGHTFGSRWAHQRLSLAQLEQLLDQAPDRFRVDVQFALRYISLMQAAHRSEQACELDLRDDFQRATKLAAAEGYLTALTAFSGHTNPIRAWVLHEQLRDLQYHQSVQHLKRKLFQYLELPRFASDIANATYVSQASVDALVVFSSPAASSFVEPPSALSVESVSTQLGDRSVSMSDDVSLIKLVLHILWTSDQLDDSDEVLLRKYLKEEFVDSHKAECMVVSGRGDLSEWKPKLPRRGAELLDWSAKTEISFCESNAVYFSPEEAMAFHVNVRNVKTLTVQVYEVRTIDYYTRQRSEVQGDICLDGLLPNEEQQIDLSHLSPWQKARVNVAIALNATGRRGVFVVEVFEKDTTCRAILRKGYLRHVQRVTTRGIEFTVLDEHGLVLKDATLMLMNLKSGGSKAQPPRTFRPVDCDTGTIVIPFRQPGESAQDKFGIIFRNNDFGYLLRGFDYTEASFKLTAQMHIDVEQLRPGEDVKLLVRPTLSVGPHQVSADILTDINVKIRVSSVDSAVAHTIARPVRSMGELVGVGCLFTIPLDAERLDVEVTARVKTRETNTAVDLQSLPTVSSMARFTVQRVTQFHDTCTPHFLRRRTFNEPSSPFEYYIAVRGHNGEPLAGKYVAVTIQQLHFSTAFSREMQTNADGEITLGTLASAVQVEVSLGTSHVGHNEWKWELPNRRMHTHQIQCAVREAVRIPVPRAYASSIESWIESGSVVLCRALENPSVHEPRVAEKVGDPAALQCVKNANGEVVAVEFTLVRAGDYSLLVRPLSTGYQIVACALKQVPDPARPADGFLVQQKKVVYTTVTQPLMIVDHRVEQERETNKTILNVQLNGASTRTTSTWIVLKRFLDQAHETLTAKWETHLVGGNRGHIGHSQQQLEFQSTILDNEYLKKRKISDEHVYILQRRAFVRANPSSLNLLSASSLPKPTLLQNPLVLDESDMEEMVLRDGDKVSGFKPQGSMAYGGGGGRGFGASAAPYHNVGTRSTSSISFLAGGSVAVACSAVSAAGVVSVCLSDLPLYSEATWPSLELVVVAFDTESSQVASLETQINTNYDQLNVIATADVRLAAPEALDDDVPSMQLQRHEVLHAGQSRILQRSFSSKFALYETLGSAMDLWSTLCSDTSVPAVVTQLKQWPAMKLRDKLAFYMKNACDELNLFIFRKDPTFFHAHIKQFVNAKLAKSLVDLFVLEDTGAVQQRYMHPGVFQRLSIVEKVLVAERAEQAELTRDLCQHVIDAIDVACEQDAAIGHQLTHVFAAVLSQGAVKPDEPQEADEGCGDGFGGFPPPGVASAASFPQADHEMQMQQQQSLFGSAAPMAARPAARPRMAMFASNAISESSMVVSQSREVMKKNSSVGRGGSSGEQVMYADDVDPYSSAEEDSDFGVESIDSDDGAASESEELPTEPDVDDDDSDGEELKRKRDAVKRRAQPYLLPGKVRRIQEKRFFTTQRPHLDGRNLFWRDYAEHLIQRVSAQETQTPRFLSSHFPEALRSFTEGMFALSVLDLPATDVTAAASVRQLAGGLQVQLDAISDVVLYHQGIGRGPVGKEPNSVVIMKQRLLFKSDLDSASSRDFADIRPAREFVVNRIYSCVVSVSNIGASRLKNLNLLRQIPRGAIPLTSTGFYTKNQVVEVAPHDTSLYTCEFYFPHVGTFTQYPAHAALDGGVIAWATLDDESTKPITVVHKATVVDLTSWSDVAARGSLEDVIAFMDSKRAIVSLGLDALAWRCQSDSFYHGLVVYLRRRWLFVESIWKYAFVHHDFVGIRELASTKNDFNRDIGSGFYTSVVQLSDVYHQERFDASFSFDHTEFGPLLARRAHRVSGKVGGSSVGLFNGSSEVAASDSGPARVLHKKAREYYRAFCQTLGLRSTATADQLLVIAYFLILFDRISDALIVFDRVKKLEATEIRDTTECSVAADYIDAYLDFFRSPPQSAPPNASAFPVARRNAKKYAKLANDRWRGRFARVREVLDEHDELVAAAARQSQQAMSSEPSSFRTSTNKSPTQRTPDDEEVRLKAEVHGEEIHFTSQHLGACEVSFYRIDVELMFSTEPFDSFSDAAASKSSLLLIQPWKQVRVELSNQAAHLAGTENEHGLVTTVLRLPPDLAASPMLLRIREVEATRTVESVASPIDLTRSYFNSQLQVVVTKQAGFVQVLHIGLPVSSCYVKVYARVSGASTARGRGSKAQFYKDGYTDVIGKFDYAAINGDLLSRVEKFSLLVSHPTLGTTVEQVAPPVLAVTSSEFKHREATEALWF